MRKKLSKLDQMIYDAKSKICADCRDGDNCKQDMKGLKYVVVNGKLATKVCGKRRGSINSYVNIKLYTNLIENKNRAKILAWLRSWNGGYIYGEPGNGKSYVLATIANEINKRGKSVYMNLANNISQGVFNFATRQKTLDEIIAADYVFIDDFGGERYMTINGFDTIFDCWTPIIKTRLDNGKPTYFSSNYSLNEMAEKIAAHSDAMTAKVLLDRIKPLGAFLFKDQDYRRN